MCLLVSVLVNVEQRALPDHRRLLTLMVLAGGQRLLAEAWEGKHHGSSMKEFGKEVLATWLWFILYSPNVAGGLGEAFNASTQRAETLIFKHHILFIVQACLIGKILNLAGQHHESHPDRDFIAWVTHWIRYWLHGGSLLLGMLWNCFQLINTNAGPVFK